MGRIEEVRKLKDKKGGRCVRCGYNKNYAALAFHHRGEKSGSLSLKVLANEDCILLCHNCHHELHWPAFSREVLTEGDTYSI